MNRTIAFLLLLSLPVASAAADKKIIAPEGSDLGLPFSPGVLSGDFLYVAGGIGNKPGTLEVPEGIEAQMRQVMANQEAVLKAAGMDFSRVVSVTVYLSDVRHFAAMNDVYRTYFPKDPPSRATVRADLMNPQFRSEIQCTAVKDPARRVVAPAGAAPATVPLSPAIEAGGRLFVSGMLGRSPNGYSADVKEQTRLTLQNLRAALNAAGLDFKDVVETMVYLSDIRNFQAMNEVYREMVGSPLPARATVGAQLMAPEALVEIVMLAVK